MISAIQNIAVVVKSPGIATLCSDDTVQRSFSQSQAMNIIRQGTGLCHVDSVAQTWEVPSSICMAVGLREETQSRSYVQSVWVPAPRLDMPHICMWSYGQVYFNMLQTSYGSSSWGFLHITPPYPVMSIVAPEACGEVASLPTSLHSTWSAWRKDVNTSCLQCVGNVPKHLFLPEWSWVAMLQLKQRVISNSLKRYKKRNHTKGSPCRYLTFLILIFYFLFLAFHFGLCSSASFRCFPLKLCFSYSIVLMAFCKGSLGKGWIVQECTVTYF